MLVLLPAASGLCAASSPQIRAVLDEAAGTISPLLRRDLAGKPSPWIIKAHDVGEPTDVHSDIPWHLLDKEKDPRFNLPHRGKLGLFNPNADIHWLIGLSVGEHAIDFNPKRTYVDHLANLAAQQIDLGSISGDILFLPVTSDTVIAVLDLANTGSSVTTVNIETRATKPAGPNEPAIHEPAAAWSRPTGRYGYGITVTSGRIQSIERIEPRATQMRFDELGPDKQNVAGSLLCTLSGSLDPTSARAEPEGAAGPSASLVYQVDVQPGASTRLTFALNLHRYGPRDVETRNQIVLYPGESNEQARARSLSAAERSLRCDWPALTRACFKWYERVPVVDLPHKSWNADFYSALELPRGNTWSAQGVLKQPWYTFCRVNGHEPYGWWSYGMHAHEHLSTTVVNLTEPTLSQSYLRGHFQVQQPDGCIQYGINHSGKNIHEPLATAPLLAGEAWRAYLWSGDRLFLAEAYLSCGRFVRWWRSPARTQDGQAGLQHWLDFIESVRDDKDLATWVATGGAEHQAALDLNCYLLNEENILAVMARELGHPAEAAAWQSDADARTATMRRLLWHAEDGVFYGRDVAKDRWARVMDISTFFPLWCGLATADQADSIARLLGDANTFGTSHPLATLAAKHMPDKMRGAYHWRGANWVEMTWLAVQGLSRCGRDDEAARIAEANCRMIFETLEGTGHFREFYNSLTGEPSDLTDYIWTAMPAVMIVETIFGIRPTTQGLEVRPALPVGWDHIRIDNLHVRDTTVSIQIDRDASGRPSAKINGVSPPRPEEGRYLVPWTDLVRQPG